MLVVHGVVWSGITRTLSRAFVHRVYLMRWSRTAVAVNVAVRGSGRSKLVQEASADNAQPGGMTKVMLPPMRAGGSVQSTRRRMS